MQVPVFAGGKLEGTKRVTKAKVVTTAALFRKCFIQNAPLPITIHHLRRTYQPKSPRSVQPVSKAGVWSGANESFTSSGTLGNRQGGRGNKADLFAVCRVLNRNSRMLDSADRRQNSNECAPRAGYEGSRRAKERNGAKHHKAVGGLDNSGKQKMRGRRHNGVSVRLDNGMLSESGRIV